MERGLTVKEVEFIAHDLAKKTMAWDEPIPNFSTRFPNILESCLNTPFQRFNKRSLYKGFVSKAAMLFYLMIKNHPFQNGNKRVAITTLLLFLYKNHKWLDTSNETLYRFAVLVAGSPPELRKEITELIEGFIEKYIAEVNNK